jgi:hypothetical protein
MMQERAEQERKQTLERANERREKRVQVKFVNLKKIEYWYLIKFKQTI